MRRYLVTSLLCLFIAALITICACADDLTPIAPVYSCDVSVSQGMVPGMLYLYCGGVTPPCTCTLTFDAGVIRGQLHVGTPEGNVTMVLVGGVE